MCVADLRVRYVSGLVAYLVRTVAARFHSRDIFTHHNQNYQYEQKRILAFHINVTFLIGNATHIILSLTIPLQCTIWYFWYLEQPPHHRHHAPSGIQKLHRHGQAITGVVVLVLARLYKQRHLTPFCGKPYQRTALLNIYEVNTTSKFSF